MKLAVPFIVFLSLIKLISSSTVHQLERTHATTSRQGDASVSQLENMAALTERLNNIETQVNASRECQKHDMKEISDIELVTVSINKTEKDLISMRKSFAKERRANERFRKRVLVLNEVIKNISDTYAAIQMANEMSTENEQKCLAKIVVLEDNVRHFANMFLDKIATFEKMIQNNKIAMNIGLPNTHENMKRNIDDKLLVGVEETIPEEISGQRHDSCQSLYDAGNTKDGLYTVYPGTGETPVKVFCDMTTDGGGWTVFQRRKEGADFFRGWKDYRKGFGDLSDEFWLGNDNIASLTQSCCHELRVEVEDSLGIKTYAKYGKFQVLPKSRKYKLFVSEFSGTSSDILSRYRGKKFTTKDRKNGYTILRAIVCDVGWWYEYACRSSLLNAGTGSMRTDYYFTEMKLR